MEFYHRNQVIFLTGATGFIGKTLLEKILRSLPSVRKIYVLLRVSGKNSLQSRVNDEIFGSRVFETLRAQFKNEQDFQEQIVSKVYPIQGDIALEKLGMSDKDIRIVQADTDLVISCAASVTFNLPLKVATNSNIHGILRLTRLADGMPHLEAFVYVSTSFVNVVQHIKNIKEEIYPYPLGKPQDVLNMIDIMTDEEVTEYERDVVLKVFPNTYITTKSLAENLLQEWRDSKNMPVTIVRPSMTGASISEPFPGWVQGMGASTGQIVFCGYGTIQEYIGDINLVSDIIPVDVVCKTILMAATQAERESRSIPIFNISTGSLNPISTNDVFYHIEQYWQQATVKNIQRTTKNIQCCMSSENDFDKRFKQRFSKEIELAKNNDQGKLRSFLKFSYDLPTTCKHFLNIKSIMDSTNAAALDKMAPPELKSHFAQGFNWTEYMHSYIMGCHEHIMKDQVDKNQVINYKWSNQNRVYSEEVDKGYTCRL
ncbi:cyclin-dependent kinase inhibitor far1 [Entomortierella beljakovae]|nr:cyclin-dependent kinase inhibitor far1 [Entomortierella beljakovae]